MDDCITHLPNLTLFAAKGNLEHHRVIPFLSVLSETPMPTPQDALRLGDASRELSTPLSAPFSRPHAAPPVPETPAKQRRTLHAAHVGPLRPAGVGRDLRKSLSRKRPPTELSQFSALQLDERSGSAMVSLFPPLTPTTPRAEWMPRRVTSGSFLPASPDRLDFSQAETEGSNFFNRRLLTDYREVRELGSGSFGRVTLYETAGGALVAVKASPPLRSAEERQRVARERTVMAATRGFPHIVALQDAWEEGRVPQAYLQLEYCRGGSVAARAERQRRRGEAWDEREVRVFAAHMALALDALHTAHIAHVDFKPDNVLIDEHGGYKLSDFGCSVMLGEDGRARAVHGWANGAVGAVGTAVLPEAPLLGAPAQLSMASLEEGDCRYLCADMLNQKRHPTAGDMFSFGVSLFELMSGEALPHHGAPFLELRRAPPGEKLRQRGYTDALVELVMALMREDPLARPTAREVLRFMQLPPDATRCIAQWATGERAGADAMDMRLMHAMLEVSARLVDVARRALESAQPQQPQQPQQLQCQQPQVQGQQQGEYLLMPGVDTQRSRVAGEEFCTPKTPGVPQWNEK